MKFPNDIKYTKDHEWVKISDGVAYIGITEFAQSELGDIVFVDVDTLNEELDQEEVFGTIEAVKTVSDLFMPISGKVDSFNKELEDSPELINVWLIKTDANGNEVWTQTFGGANYEEGLSVQQSNDGGYIITGTTLSFGNGVANIYLIKTDGNGNELWNKTFVGTNNNWSYSVQQTTDGGYIVIGYTNSFGNGAADVYLIKTDGSGNELWNKTFGGVNDDGGFSVQQTNDGGYVVAGYTKSVGNGDADVYLIKTDGSGNELWNKTFGGTYEDGGFDVQQTTDGGYILTGKTLYAGGVDSDLYLIKTDGNGNVSSIFNIPPSSKRKLKKTVNILGKEIISDQNNLFIEIYDDGSSEKKLIIEN